MSITTYLQQILAARYGEEVRQAIHDSIEEGYNIAVQAQGTAETSQESAEAYANAALASEQAAQGYMELAEQYKNEAFSGTPTGYSDLVAKVNSIYQETASSFGVVDTVEGLALPHTIYGMSEQDGTPTPSVPVDIDSAVANFKCVGKNLIEYPFNNTSIGIWTDNGDGTVTANGTPTSNSFFFARRETDKKLKLYAGKKYKLSGCPSGGNTTSTYRMYLHPSVAGAISGNNDTGTGSTYTVTADCYVDVVLEVFANYAANNLVFKPMITLNGADQTWEEYKSKAITTDLTLRAIEVTSSDDYNLVKDGKYYIADTLDWDEDSGYSITRRIAYRQFTSFDGFSSTFNDTTHNMARNLVAFFGASVVLPSSFDVIASIKSNYFTPVSRNNLVVNGIQGIALSGANVLFQIDGMTSTGDYGNWISDKTVEVYAIYETPTTESVTSAQAQALLGLKTYDEATSIDATGDVAPSIDLEYSKDRNTALALIGHNMAHINALKIADLS